MIKKQESHWKQFGSWLRRQRRNANLSQKALAEAIGISEVQLARIEKGESGTRRGTVIEISKALDIDHVEALYFAGFCDTEPIVSSVTSLEFDGSKIPNFANGRSLNQIALAVGISRQFMGEIVRGVSKPSSDVALRIAHVLECSVNDFSNEKNLRNLSATA